MNENETPTTQNDLGPTIQKSNVQIIALDKQVQAILNYMATYGTLSIQSAVGRFEEYFDLLSLVQKEIGGLSDFAAKGLDRVNLYTKTENGKHFVPDEMDFWPQLFHESVSCVFQTLGKLTAFINSCKGVEANDPLFLCPFKFMKCVNGYSEIVNFLALTCASLFHVRHSTESSDSPKEAK